jgi:hypothetical protein
MTYGCGLYTNHIWENILLFVKSVHPTAVHTMHCVEQRGEAKMNSTLEKSQVPKEKYYMCNIISDVPL